MYWDDLQHHDGGAGIDDIWLSNPIVRQEANRRVSGDANVWPTAWLRQRLASELPLKEVLVIGCGTGGLERDLARTNTARAITGIDLAEEPLGRARELAAAEGLQERISYHRADAARYLSERRSQFDAVFFHASLHHFDAPYDILLLVRDSLRPRGLLYFDEYVGPSRHQWSLTRLLLPNLAYRLLPRRLRRPHLVRAPINFADPTEAPASHEIMSAARRLFEIVAVRDYGGNLLSIVYPNLHRPPNVASETFDRGIQRLINFERVLLATPGVQPYYVVTLARRKAEAES